MRRSLRVCCCAARLGPDARVMGLFFAAIAVFAAGLGNHTTIVALAPGMAVYALMTDRRFATRSRTLAATAAIVSAGILQYAFILIRSHQPGVYLESRATTAGELLNVMLGRPVPATACLLSGGRPSCAIAFRRLLEHVLAVELTIPGLMLAVAGARGSCGTAAPKVCSLLPTVGIIVGFRRRTIGWSTRRCS